ncbi:MULTISPECIES: holo-ACP synthase [Chroococcidiopsis]|jgi:holo-[acyl-carrier protein] synthase|uniref:Holo-[acyl-carrier-protein] synthase n=1 Tax=Chroococcidiopsis thermalis (strain PCC 7203) TaxID=251229 RepID=K9TYF9_CHRTP|nr:MULTISPECIES: holo-ACP synthase [Chroococcidiopsis]AFY87211.1 holo-acyl-carrier-protein synthase [Chroococcidiopsis thermalis PCC 7203]PSB45738.1 holo-[acyl-carrier-protein] synthase [Cyanosarcina cf. burmensis CCALA 770]URD52089.1 holo-ACP synthase [Chroococcidiopsis sp. CCNUC1]
MLRLGTDIIYIPRIEKVIGQFGDRFLQRVYTPNELLDCRYEQNAPSRNVMNKLAGRWAAKEAVVKALGTGWLGVGYTDVEICRQPSGVPTVQLHARALAMVDSWGQLQWQLSLSHDGDYAIATAILVCS